jgi:hypothetical protein
MRFASLARAFLAAGCILNAVPAAAMQQPDSAVATSTGSTEARQPPLQIVSTQPPVLPAPPPAAAKRPAPADRPAALAPLYVSLVSVNILDVDSTYDALRSANGREANPIVSRIVDRPAVFIAVKAATTAVSIWTAEKLWKKHRIAAVAVVGIANATLAATVVNNYRIARR